MLDAFQSVNKEFGVTISVVAHDLLAARRAHRQLHLRDGQLLVEGRPMKTLATDGRAKLPDEAIDALARVDLEVEDRDGEVRIRRKGEGTGRWLTAGGHRVVPTAAARRRPARPGCPRGIARRHQHGPDLSRPNSVQPYTAPSSR